MILAKIGLDKRKLPEISQVESLELFTFTFSANFLVIVTQILSALLLLLVTAYIRCKWRTRGGRREDEERLFSYIN